MIVTGALLHGKADHFLQHQHDQPCALQLGGSDPAELRACAIMGEEYGYQEINLNVGCPSDRVQDGGIGACLMATPDLVGDCVAAMASQVSIPVTVKCRIGIDDNDSYGFFEDFVTRVHAAGCRTFIVHARSAILSGLSPKQNREIPPLRYDYVYRIREQFADSAFVINGGIDNIDDALQRLSQAGNIMLGRAIYNNPFLLAELERAIYQQPVPDRLEILANYRQYVQMQMDAGADFKHMARHLLGLFSGVRGARVFRRHLSTHMFDARATARVLDDALQLAGFSDAGSEAETVITDANRSSTAPLTGVAQ